MSTTTLHFGGDRGFGYSDIDPAGRRTALANLERDTLFRTVDALLSAEERSERTVGRRGYTQEETRLFDDAQAAGHFDSQQEFQIKMEVGPRMIGRFYGNPRATWLPFCNPDKFATISPPRQEPETRWYKR